jgi:hypothetical protein
MKQLKEIPTFKSEDEEREFWDKAEIFDYLDPAKFVETDPPMVPKTKDLVLHQVLADMSTQVERLSREQKMSVEDMVRQLVAVGLKHRGLQPGA